MRRFLHVVSLALVASAAALLMPAVAHAQATRTWVSGVGDDVNPCSRTAPCKTFAGAISKTAACGEINALDPAGYGAVTITKPITIDGKGTNASILASGTNGININITAAPASGCPTGAPWVVTLRNLSINGAPGTGLNGIRVFSVDELHVENVAIFGFQGTGTFNGNGIDFNSSRPAALFISDSSITNNINAGVLMRPVGVAGQATMKRVLLNQNGTGMFMSDGAVAIVSDSVASGHVNYGFQVAASGVAAKLQLDRAEIFGNGAAGIRTDGSLAVIRLSNSTIVQNATGISNGGGTIATFGNNSIAGNLPGGDGATTMSFPLK